MTLRYILSSAQIDVPTLLMRGAGDQIIPLGEAEAMRDGIHESKLVVAPEAGALAGVGEC